MASMNISREKHSLLKKWYLFAQNTLRQYQQEQVQRDDLQKQLERESVMKELKDDLDKVNDTFAHGSKVEFLKYVHATYPPKHPQHYLSDEARFEHDYEVKKLYLKPVAHYCPDRVDEEDHGVKWKVLFEEITKMLSKQHQVFKGGGGLDLFLYVSSVTELWRKCSQHNSIIETGIFV